ncbi:MAG: hypothetical protein WD042_18460 [Phycisphaeraceae bacterium]
MIYRLLPLTMFAAAMLWTSLLQAADPVTAKVISGTIGDDPAGRIVQTRTAIADLYSGDLATFRLRARLRLAAAPQRGGPGAVLAIGPEDPASLIKPGLARINIMRSSGEQDGRFLRFQAMRPGEAGKWAMYNDRPLPFWPNDKGGVKGLEADGIAPRSWHNQWIDLRVDVGKHEVIIWADGIYVDRVKRPHVNKPVGPIVIELIEGDALGEVTIEAWDDHLRYLPVELEAMFNDRAGKPIASPASEVPFVLARDGVSHLNLRDAGWIDQKRDPQTFYESYDGGPYYANDPRMPLISVPRADYVAAHVLAVADNDPQRTDTLTLRAGRYGYMKQVLRREYVTQVPRRAQAGEFAHVVVPLTEVLAQDMIEDVIEIELTKELRLARHVPDPNRFRYRPLGLPSGVRIAAITLEKSPLQMRVTSDEAGHAFVEPKTPAFTVQLANITDTPQPYKLSCEATHLRGGESRYERSGTVAAGEVTQVTLPIAPVRRGYHDLTVTLRGAADKVLLRRTTSFAQLGPETRQHRDTTPFGSWEWNGTHVTSKDSDAIGSLYQKMGFRFGMSSHPVEARQKWGMAFALEPKLDPELTRLKKMSEKNSVKIERGLIFHEDSISGGHVTRVPDLFHDRPPYKLNEKEEARYQTMLASALGAAKAAREQFPDLFLSFGNGPLPTKEEFYRRGFPADLFDAGGNEAGSFHRLPEAQPPDFIANNASLWMDRQLLDAYGYADKPVHQCLEVGYPGDSPGNHTSATQADYFVRNALHSLAWGMTFLHIGEIIDVGNSYYFSNWGSAGFCRAYPEMNVKPSYVALATMTTVLDGATCVRVHDTGSPTVYALEFERADGQRVLAFWTIHGQRPLTVDVAGGPWASVDDQGNESAAPVQVLATASPAYLIGKGEVRGIRLGEPRYDDAPPVDATVVAALDSLDNWTVVTDRNAELEAYNPLTPRRKGDFEFAAVADVDGRGGALRVTPKPIRHGKDTMPMYAQLKARQAVALPGEPDEIGLWVNGNSGWGRVIFEFKDASGQRWVSLGAATTEAPPWQLDWMPKEMQDEAGPAQMSDWSTNDSFGYSLFNFDGWRYVGFPLPGNYPGEHHPWPANSFWRWDGDGIVRYPLTLTHLSIELPEKVLHVKTWAPVARPSIDLQNLLVGTRRHAAGADAQIGKTR